MSNIQRNGVTNGAINSHQYNSRSNSITSFNSFSSKQSQTPSHLNVIPRASSTNDLVSVDPIFTKAPRSHKSFLPRPTGMRQSQSQTNLSSVRMNSIQSSNTNDMISFGYQPQTFTSSSRKQSLTSVNSHLQNQFQHQTTSFKDQHNTYRAPNPMPKRRPNQRHSHDVPFTFPNGEIYIPRSKQRSSSMDIRSSNSELNHQQIDLTNNVPLNSQTMNNYNQNKSHMTSPILTKQNIALQPQNLHQHSLSSASNSTSPSPSRNSKAESINESTPASSIDDLSTHGIHIKDGPANYLSDLSENNYSPNDSSISEDSIPIQVPSLGMIEEMVVEPEHEISSPQDDIPKVEVKPVLHRSLLDDVSDVTPPTSSHKTPTPVIKKKSPTPPPQQLAKVTPKVQKAPKVTQQPLEKKPSGLRKVFSKIFGRSKSKKVTPKASESVKPTSSISTVKKTTAVIPKPKPTPEPVVVQKETPNIKIVESTPPFEEGQAFDDQASDQFSFMDGDEKINVQRNSSYFDGDQVLASMFAAIDNKSKSQLQSSSVDVPVKFSGETDEDDTINTTTDDTIDEDENETISFDDLEMIDKIIQFGETSFPDLASPDLGEAERKRMRSKSIERKKSIRSINSSRSKVSNNSTILIDQKIDNEEEDDEDLFVLNDHAWEVITSETKEPGAQLTPSCSILKPVSAHHHINHHPYHHNHRQLDNLKQQKESDSVTNKKVYFTNKIFVNKTYSALSYDRHSQPLTNLKLNPKFLQQVRYELNDFKRSMEVHESSKKNTHFFPA